MAARKSSNPVEEDFDRFADMMEADFAGVSEDMAGVVPIGHNPMTRVQQVQLADMMQQRPELRRYFVGMHGESEVARMEEETNKLRVAKGVVPE